MRSSDHRRNRYTSLSDSCLCTWLTIAAAFVIVADAQIASGAGAATNGPAAQAAAGTGSSSPDAVTAPTDPVLNLLLEKGMITEEEAAKTQAQADNLRTNLDAEYAAENSKWKISRDIKDIEIFGDVRLRYESREEADPVEGHPATKKTAALPMGRINLNRFRYSLRFGMRGDTVDDFYYGFRLETSSNPRSTWVTMGNSNPDPYGKSGLGIEFGQAYGGWQPTSWFDFTVGKMPNPLYTSSLVWSPSINPEGLAEHLKYDIGGLQVFANFAQFLYQDENPIGAAPNLGFGTFGQSQDNIFQVAWQGGFDYHITTNISFKVGATIYQYFGLKSSSPKDTGLSPYFGDVYIGESPYLSASGAGLGTFYPGESGYSPGTVFNFLAKNGTSYSSLSYPLNQVGLDHLEVLEIPFEFNVNVWKLNFKAFGDFAYNLDGRARAQSAATGYQAYLDFASPAGGKPAKGFKAQVNDVKAYQFGLAVGNRNSLGLVNGTTSKKNGWELRSYWQHVEQYSLDPNLLDLDFNAGAENLEGFYVAFAYGFGENTIATVRYGHANRINNLLGTGGTGTDIPWINPIKSFDLLQADLTFRF